VLASVGGVLGLTFGHWATGALAAMLTARLPFNLVFAGAPDPVVVMVTIAFAGLGTIAFGLGPALTLSRRNLVADLKDRGSEGAMTRRRFGPRNLMVIGQVALSLALLTAGGIVARTAVTAAGQSPGFEQDRLLVASLDTTLAGLDAAHGRVAYGDVLTRVREMPGVWSASLASTIPFGDSQEGRLLEPVGETTSAAVRAKAFRIVGADYFRTLGLDMLRGREFTVGEETSPESPSVAIVDAAFARKAFGDENPIGRVIREVADVDEAGTTTTSVPMEIVGVAPPLREELLDGNPVPHVYVPFGRHFRAGMHLHAKLIPGSNEALALDSVRGAVRTADARLPLLRLSTMQAMQARSLELLALRAMAGVFTGLAALALLLATIGVYGVRAYVVANRTREIGIRMALGATARDVVRLILSDGVVLAGAGVGLGLPLAVLVSIALRSVFVDVGGVDYVVLAAATAVLAVASIAASALPARRAARVEPLRSLRAE